MPATNPINVAKNTLPTLNQTGITEIFEPYIGRIFPKMCIRDSLCAYAYADAGRGESTTDLVFAAHNLIAENGILCAESRLFENEPVLCDVDVEKLCVERMKNTSFDTQSAEDDGYEVVWFSQQQKEKALMRAISRAPFVPEDTAELRCV